MVDVAEVAWLVGDCPHRMYGVIRHHATTRKIRLFMAACCRLHSDAFFDPRIAQALAAVDRCADSPRAEAEAEAVWGELVTSSQHRRTPRNSAGEVELAILAAWQLLDEHWAGVEYRSVQHALAHAAYLALRERPGDVFTGGEGDAAEYCAEAVEAAENLAGGGGAVRRRMAGLLRDIFGNPFRSVAVEPRWRTDTVLAVARGIYADRAFDRLPILADAIQDAGCADADILDHCRGPVPHVRGCWVVDLVLGKE